MCVIEGKRCHSLILTNVNGILDYLMLLEITLVACYLAKMFHLLDNNRIFLGQFLHLMFLWLFISYLLKCNRKSAG